MSDKPTPKPALTEQHTDTLIRVLDVAMRSGHDFHGLPLHQLRDEIIRLRSTERPQQQNSDGGHETVELSGSQPKTEIPEDVALLMKFYSVDTLADLIRMQARHVEHLQAKVPPLRDERPGRVREG